jgi:gas vesicle protein
VHQLGGEYEDADKALAGFSKAFGLAHAQFTKRAVKPFQALGLDPKDFASRPRRRCARSSIKHLAPRNPPPSRRRSPTSWASPPCCRPSAPASVEMDRLRQAAHAPASCMDAELIEKAGDANDEFESLSKIIDIQFKSAFIELAPVILQVMGLVKDFAVAVADLAAQFQSLGDRSNQALQHSNEKLVKQLAVVNAGAGFKPDANQKRLIADLSAKIAANQAILDKREAEKTAPVFTGGSSGHSVVGKSGGNHVADASAAAIDQAAKAELQARIALTHDTEQLAALRIAEVQQETAAANDRLTREAAEHKITAAAAATAIALNDKAAAEQVAAIEADAEQQALDDAVRLRTDINRYYDEIARIQANLAGTAAEQNAIEDRALKARQEREARELADQLKLDVASGKRTQSAADALAASQKDLHAAERQAQASEDAARLSRERIDTLEQATQGEIDVLRSQQALAATESERAQLGLRILDLQQQLERAKLQEVIATKGAASAEGRLARGALDTLRQVQGNERQAAERDSIAAQIHDVGDALASFGEAFSQSTADKISQGFDHVAQAFASGGPIFAAMAAINEVGKAVGGGFGAFLSGFGQGGIVGGIASLIGHNKAKKKAKKAKAAAAAAEAKQKAEELAASRRDLELHIMELEGKSAEALAGRRADELAAMDESLRPLKEREYALEDEAAAAEKAAALVAARYDLETELLRQSGDEAGALARDRAKALEGLDESLRPLQQKIYDVIDANKAREASEAALAEAVKSAQGDVDHARSDLTDAYEREADALKSTEQKFTDLADALHAAGEQIRTLGLAGNPAGNLASARANLDRLSARVAAGDTSALDDLQAAAEAFSDASRTGSKTAAENARNQAAARKALAAGEALARAQVDVAHQQLDALNTLVAGQVEVRDATLSVVDAMNNLTAALGSLEQANKDAARVVDLRPPDIAAITDAVMVPSATERVDVTSPGSTVSNADVVAVLDTLVTATQQGVVNSGQTVRLFKRWDGDGLPDVRDVAA